MLYPARFGYNKRFFAGIEKSASLYYYYYYYYNTESYAPIELIFGP
jgi:hypothetical protein